MAIAHPGSFERLALLGLGDNVFDTSDPSTLAASLEEGEAEPEDVQARLFHRMAASIRKRPGRAVRLPPPAPGPIREDELSAVTCPVLVVLGERDMTKTADRLVAALPSASFVSVPGVDHFATPSDFGVIDATMRFFGFE